MFSEKSLGTVSTWNENKIPVYTQKASLSTIQQDLGNIVEDVKNLGMIFNVQDKANEYAAQLQTKIDAVKKANPASQGEKKKALIMVAYNDETFRCLQVCFARKFAEPTWLYKRCYGDIRLDLGKSRVNGS